MNNDQNLVNSNGVDTRTIDMLLGKLDSDTVDSEKLIEETQRRVWAALKRGYEYSDSPDKSEEFLRKNVFSRVEMVVLYVDLVGSTQMALELPEDKLAIIISSFAQEMAYMVQNYEGYVLKFVGDAVIAYFVATNNSLQAADDAVQCAKAMISVLEHGINPILNQYDYPDLKVKIGIDFGKNIIIRYGADAERSRVDIMGPAMNIAAKIQSMAKPNQILVGLDVYTRLHPTLQKKFKEVVWRHNEWHYRSRITGELYNVYQYFD